MATARFKLWTVQELTQKAEESEKEMARIMSHDEEGITFKPFIGQGSYTYYIEWKELDTQRKLLDWIVHLSGKKWVSTDLIARLVSLCTKKFRYR